MADRGNRSVNNTPPLVAAARDRNLSLVMQLVNQGHSLNARDKHGATALYWACCRGYDEISQYLLSAGSDINARVMWGATALLAAADNGQDVCVRQLLGEKIDVNATNDRGDTPLHAAAYRGYVNILRLLMEARANPFLKNSASMTPLQEALAQRHYECVSLLQQYMDVVPGSSGAICLSSPDLSSVTSHAQSMEESHKSWPHVSVSYISRLCHEARKEKAYSLRLPKIDIFDNDGDAISVRDKAAIINNFGYSENVQTTVELGNNQSRESLPNSSLGKTRKRDSVNVDSSSSSELATEGQSGRMSFDSLLMKMVPIPSRSSSQGAHRKCRRSTSQFSSNSNQRRETQDFPNKIDVVQDSEEQYKINQKMPTATTFLPRDVTLNARDFFEGENKLSLSQSATIQNYSPSLNLVLSASEKLLNQSGHAHVLKEVLPGESPCTCVAQLQHQMLEVQEKLIQSNILIAQLRKELHEVQRENAELMAENYNLRNLCSQHEPFSLRARGSSDSADDLSYVTCLPEISPSVANTAEAVVYGTNAGSRRAVESSENEVGSH